MIPFKLREHNPLAAKENHYGMRTDGISLLVYRRASDDQIGEYTIKNIFAVKFVTSLRDVLCEYQIYQSETGRHYCNNVPRYLRSATLPVHETTVRPMFDALLEYEPMEDYIFLDALLMQIAETNPTDFDQEPHYQVLAKTVRELQGLNFTVQPVYRNNVSTWDIQYAPA